MPLIGERQHTHTFAAFHNAIDGDLAVWHLGDIFAHTRPGILVNRRAGEGFPRFWGHSSFSIMSIDFHHLGWWMNITIDQWHLPNAQGGLDLDLQRHLRLSAAA